MVLAKVAYTAGANVATVLASRFAIAAVCLCILAAALLLRSPGRRGEGRGRR